MDPLSEPRLLLSQVMHKFEPQPDTKSVIHVSSTIEKLLAARQACLDNLADAVRKCKRDAELLHWESVRPSHCSREVHEQKVDDLERAKFLFAKNIQDNEADLLRLDADISRMQQYLEQLESAEKEYGNEADVEVACKIYSLFGVNLVEMEGNENDKVLVVGNGGDASVISRDSYSKPVEFCDAVWQAIGSN